MASDLVAASRAVIRPWATASLKSYGTRPCSVGIPSPFLSRFTADSSSFWMPSLIPGHIFEKASAASAILDAPAPSVAPMKPDLATSSGSILPVSASCCKPFVIPVASPAWTAAAVVRPSFKAATVGPSASEAARKVGSRKVATAAPARSPGWGW